MAAPLAPRKRAALGADLRIVLLGVWGFVLQTLKCWLRGGNESDELGSGH